MLCNNKETMSKIKILENHDKDQWREKEETDDLFVIKRGCKVLICALPDYGKSNLCKNIIAHSNAYKPYDKIFLCHIDKNTREYDELSCDICDISELPNVEQFNPSEKTLIIFEDVCFRSLKRADKEKLMMLLRYGCSHRGITIITLCHSFYTLPPVFRDKNDVFIIYLFNKRTMNDICDKVYIKKDNLERIINDNLKCKYDFLCIDLTGNRPAITCNMTKVISEEIERY